MTIRTFGAKLAPGVRIEERQGEQPLIPSLLGGTGYVGILEKGPINELINCPNLRTLERKTGTIIADSLLPDVTREFFAMSQGSGELQLVRVADGNQRYAYYDKKYFSDQGSGIVATTVRTLRNRRYPAQAVIEVKAKSEGRWGGKEYAAAYTLTGVGEVSDSPPTVTLTGETPWPDNFLKGGTLKLEEVTTKSYAIIGNAVVGSDTLIYLATDTTPATDLGAAPVSLDYTVEVVNEQKYLEIEVGDGNRDYNFKDGMNSIRL